MNRIAVFAEDHDAVRRRLEGGAQNVERTRSTSGKGRGGCGRSAMPAGMGMTDLMAKVMSYRSRLSNTGDSVYGQQAVPRSPWCDVCVTFGERLLEICRNEAD
jgi:hypothetical protein